MVNKGVEEGVGKMNMRRYTMEFKQQAVELAENLGSAVGAARQLGISYANIYVWRQKFGKTKSSSPDVNLSEGEELKRLRKENAELKKVNHILKGAAAFFSQDHLK